MSLDDLLVWVHIAGFGMVVVLSINHLRYVWHGPLAILTLAIMRLLSSASLCTVFAFSLLGLHMDSRLVLGPLPLLIWIVYVFDIQFAPERTARRPETLERLMNGRDDV